MTLFSLKILKCPLVNDVDNDWMLEHLTKPCHQRLQILQWLFSKIDGKLAEMIEANKFTEEGKQTKDLLNMASTLGFCSLDQIDLIKGSASAKDQVRFLSLILDTVEMCHEEHIEDHLLPDISNLVLLTESPDIEREYECQCQLIDDITRQPNIMDNLLCTTVELLPADIKRQVNLNMSESSEQQQKLVPLVSLYHEKASQLRQDLVSYEAQLDDLQKKFEFQRVDKEQLESLCQRLEESLLELKEEIGKFNSCYDNEMKLWCNKQPTTPTRLGPVFERAYTLLNNFESMLVTFDDIRVSSGKIENLKTSETSNQNLRNTSDGFLLDFKELLNTLEVSVNNHRQDSIETDLIK